MQTKSSWLILTGLTLAAIVFAGILILPGATYAQGPGFRNGGQYSCSQNGSNWQSGMMGRFMGMMGESNCGGGWTGGMMGSGMMSGLSYQPLGQRLGLDEAHDIAERYAEDYNSPGRLEVKEVMEFRGNFYAEVVEVETGIGAFEILIDPVSGSINPEPGPNMMWNTKYGMHSGSGMMGGFMNGMMSGSWGQPNSEMTVNPTQALAAAQSYLDQFMPGLTVGDEVDRFYGYYTLHTMRDAQIEGMLSVNGSSGQVWYHSWHGDFIDMTADAHD